MFHQIFLISTFLLTTSIGSSKTSEQTSIIRCSDFKECISNYTNCEEICGCDGPYYVYNETISECVIDLTYLTKLTTENTVKSEDEFDMEDGLAKKIRMEAENIFRGILISVLLFIICAAVCVTVACFYCCRINYTDHTLHKDVKALAKKTKREQHYKKIFPKKPQLEPREESCNVVVEGAGVFVV